MRRCEMYKNLFFVANLITGDIFYQEELKTDMTIFLCWPVLFHTMIPKKKHFDTHECFG